MGLENTHQNHDCNSGVQKPPLIVSLGMAVVGTALGVSLGMIVGVSIVYVPVFGFCSPREQWIDRLMDVIATQQ